MSSAKPRRPREKPLAREVADFVRWHLGDKRAFAPFTGTDYDAWHAFIYLVRLYGRTRSGDVINALRATLHTAQTRHEDVMAIFKKSIPCLLDWSDEPKIWIEIAPRTQLDEVTEARVRRAIDRFGLRSVFDQRFIAGGNDLFTLLWPCSDGPRAESHPSPTKESAT